MNEEYQKGLESRALTEVNSLMENFRLTNFSVSKKLQGRNGYRVTMIFDESTQGIDFVYDMHHNRVHKGDVVFFKDGGTDGGVTDVVIDFIEPTGEVLIEGGYIAMPNQIELQKQDKEDDLLRGSVDGEEVANAMRVAYAEGNF